MEQEEVLIHGVSYNAMCQILHFIYTSELELSLSNVQETLVAACQLQVRCAFLERGDPCPGGVSLGAHEAVCESGSARQGHWAVRETGARRRPLGGAWLSQLWALKWSCSEGLQARVPALPLPSALLLVPSPHLGLPAAEKILHVNKWPSPSV